MRLIRNLVTGFALILSFNAQALTIVVDTNSGGSGGPDCSLADAIIAANTGSTSAGCTTGSNGADEIVFDSSLNNTVITLTAPLPVVTDDLDVIGPIEKVAISGDNTYSIFIIEGVKVNLANLRLERGIGTTNGIFSSGAGGAVAALGGALVNIDESYLTGNSAVGSSGGAIYSEYSAVNLEDSWIENNTAHRGGGVFSVYGSIRVLYSVFRTNNTVSTSSVSTGGAIDANGGADSSLFIKGSYFINNENDGYGGAVFINDGVSASVYDTTFSDNSAYWAGGAIRVQGASASLRLTNSYLIKNSSNIYGGGLYSEIATVNIGNTTFLNNSAQNSGGAIFAYSGTVDTRGLRASSNNANKGGAVYVYGHPNFPNGSFNLKQAIISDNTSLSYGGAIAAENNAFLKVIHSTLDNNSSVIRGGAVLSDESIVEFSNSTVSGNDSGNEGGALYANNSSSIKLNNSTFAENIGGSVFAFNFSGAVMRNSVLADGGCYADPNSSVVLTDGVHIDDGTCGATLTGPSQLGPLDFNGGPTRTHLPLLGSPLVDSGVAGGNPTTDQRGFARVVGGVIDIGAVELSDPPMFDIDSFSALMQNLEVGQSIAIDLNSYISDTDSSKFTVTATGLPRGLRLDSESNLLQGELVEAGVFKSEYTIEDDTGNQIKVTVGTTVAKSKR